MPRLVYLNGKFLPDVEAHISIFDRGFLFSDAVYEVTAVIDKKLVSWEGHLNRLRYSLKELNIDFTKFWYFAFPGWENEWFWYQIFR